MRTSFVPFEIISAMNQCSHLFAAFVNAFKAFLFEYFYAHLFIVVNLWAQIVEDFGKDKIVYEKKKTANSAYHL